MTTTLVRFTPRARYGEADPEYANAHEDARRLTPRVALVVRLQP